MSDDLYRLRAETLASMQERNAREAEELVTQINELRQGAREAYESGDKGTAQYYDEQLMTMEQDLQTKMLELERNAPPQQLTATQTDLLNRHGGDLHKAHWSGMPGANNFHAMEWADRYAKANGIDPNSQQYKDIIQVVTPEGGNELPTPNQICRDLNLDAKAYNRGVRQLQARKARGDYK
jgi:hypothetical protein